jgi:hypothetical protein
MHDQAPQRSKRLNFKAYHNFARSQEEAIFLNLSVFTKKINLLPVGGWVLLEERFFSSTQGESQFKP